MDTFFHGKDWTELASFWNLNLEVVEGGTFKPILIKSLDNFVKVDEKEALTQIIKNKVIDDFDFETNTLNPETKQTIQNFLAAFARNNENAGAIALAISGLNSDYAFTEWFLRNLKLFWD